MKSVLRTADSAGHHWELLDGPSLLFAILPGDAHPPGSLLEPLSKASKQSPSLWFQVGGSQEAQGREARVPCTPGGDGVPPDPQVGLTPSCRDGLLLPVPLHSQLVVLACLSWLRPAHRPPVGWIMGWPSESLFCLPLTLPLCRAPSPSFKPTDTAHLCFMAFPHSEQASYSSKGHFSYIGLFIGSVFRRRVVAT